MKKGILYITMLLLSVTGYAQIEKGQGLLTGRLGSSINRYSYEDADIKTRTIKVSTLVSYGTFIKRSVLLGAEVSVDGSQTKTTVPISNPGFFLKNYSNSVSVTPFARYYWQYGKLIVYAGGGVTLTGAWSGSRISGDTIRGTTRSFAANISGQIGAVYPISGRIGLELYARTSGLPVTITNAGLGLVLYTGAHNQPFLTTAGDKFAQLSKGGVVLSAGFSTSRVRQITNYPLNSNKPNIDNTTLGTTASVGVGYFIHDRTQAGVHGSYTFGSNVQSDLIGGYVGAGPINYVSVEPYVKRYLSESTLTPYVGGQLIWQLVKAGGPSTTAYGGRVSAGLAYLLGSRFIVEAELIGIQSGYSKGFSYTDAVGTASVPNAWSASLNATLRPSFALNYVFH